MLVVSRKPGEQILIGDNIVITLVSINKSRVRIGIAAPDGTRIIRSELERHDDNTGEHGGALGLTGTSPGATS